VQARTLAFLILIFIGAWGRGVVIAEPPEAEKITVKKDIAYREGPSRQWRLDLAMPVERAAIPRPGIVVIHGGGWIEGDKSSFAGDDRAMPGNIAHFASLGFVAVTINYRLASEAPFPAALEDCKCAVRWLRAQAEKLGVDPDHIGAFGNSAGGHLALLLGLTGGEKGLEGDGPHKGHSSRVQAVFSDSGPIDLLAQERAGALREVCRRFLGGPPEGKRADAYRLASPISRVTPQAPPILLVYGVLDEQVPIEIADGFVAALDRSGAKDVSYHRLARTGHCPYSLLRVPYLRPIVDEFFLRTLGPKLDPNRKLAPGA
jgi:acetyl esterase/lipase